MFLSRQLVLPPPLIFGWFHASLVEALCASFLTLDMEEALPLHCILRSAQMHDPSALKLVRAGASREKNGAVKDAGLSHTVIMSVGVCI